MALKHLTPDDVLQALGLERRHSMVDVLLPMLGVFGSGLLVGAGLGLLLAPKAGRQLRTELRTRVDELRHHRHGAEPATETTEAAL